MKDCPRCHGSGEIGWNDSPINDPQCAQEATCNVCHGEGVVMLEDNGGLLHYRDALERIAHHQREGDVAGQVNAMRAIARTALEGKK